MKKQGKKSQNKTNNQIKKVIDAFLNPEIRAAKFGRYIIDGDRLVFRTHVIKNMRISNEKFEDFVKEVQKGNIFLKDISLVALKELHLTGRISHRSVEFRCLGENVIAKRIRQDDKVLFVGNQQVLDLINRRMVFGRAKTDYTATEIQIKLAEHIPFLNFKFFDSDGTDLREQCEGWKRISEQKPGFEDVKVWIWKGTCAP